LAISLHDPNLERIVVTRLEATARTVTPTFSEIGALALLVPSSAHFDRSTFLTWEPDPRAVSLAKKLGEDSAFQKHMDEYLDGLERHRDRREAEVSGAFPEHDARRLLKDTIFGFSAAGLSDVTQRLGESAVDRLSDRRRRLRRTAVAPHPFVPALAGEAIRFPDQRFADASLFLRALGQYPSHRARFGDLLRQGLPATADRGC
jgi:hypothetical protein